MAEFCDGQVFFVVTQMINAHFDEDDGKGAEIPKLERHKETLFSIRVREYIWAFLGHIYWDYEIALTIEVMHSQSSHHNFWRRIRLLIILTETVAADSIVIAIMTLIPHARIPFSDASPRAVMIDIMDALFAFPFITEASSGLERNVII